MTLNDGTKVNGFATVVNNILIVYVFDITLSKAFSILDKPAKTSRIVCERNGDESIFEGYTHLASISEGFSGMISASLKKE
jgi:hypothetical protein